MHPMQNTKSTKDSAAPLQDEGMVGTFPVDDMDGLPVPPKKVTIDEFTKKSFLMTELWQGRL